MSFSIENLPSKTFMHKSFHQRNMRRKLSSRPYLETLLTTTILNNKSDLMIHLIVEERQVGLYSLNTTGVSK